MFWHFFFLLRYELYYYIVLHYSLSELLISPISYLSSLSPSLPSLLSSLVQIKNTTVGTSLVGQWLRIPLPLPGTRVQSLVQEDPTCHGATKPVCHNCWACKPQLLRLHATTTEACAPRARAPQQEKPPQWEARALQQRPNAAKNNFFKKTLMKLWNCDQVSISPENEENSCIIPAV